MKEYRFEQSGIGDMAELEVLQASLKAGKQRLGNLLQQRSSLSVAVESMEQRFAGHRDEFIRNQRRNATGQKFKSYGLADGRKLQDAVIMSIDDAGVTIRHSDGSARLRYADLDEAQRQFFGLEETSSLAAQEQESREALAYERWIDSGVAAVREKEEQASAAARSREQRAERTRNLLASNQISSANVSPLSQPAKSFGGYSGYYSSYRYNRPTYRYIYYSNPRPYSSSASYYGNLQRISDLKVLNPAPVNNYNSFSNTTIPYIP